MSLFYGFSGGIATPIRIGEYVGRKLPFENTGLLKVTISTLVEKWASLIIILVTGAVVSFYFVNYYYSFLYALPFLLFLFVLFLLIGLFFKGYYLSHKWLMALSEKFVFVENLITEIKYIKQLGKETLRKLIIYASLLYFVLILQYGLLTLAFDNNGNFINYIIAGVIVMFVKSILSFISFADLGIRESTSVFILNKMGYSKAVGFNAAIFLFFFNLVLPSLIGLIFLFKREK